MHQKCFNYALTNLLFGLCISMWIIDLLITLSFYPGAPTCPSTPKVLWARERASIPHPFVIFTFKFVVESTQEFGGASLSATKFQKQNDKTTCELSNGRPGVKPRDVYDNKKKSFPTIEGETKIPLLVIICGLINFFIWIRVEVENNSCLLKNPKKSLILRTPKDTFIIPI